MTDDYAERQVDSTVFSIHDIDSLSTVMESYASGGNTYGEMVAARELGKKLRNVSRFYDAIDVHKKGLIAAEKLRDTIQIVQALILSVQTIGVLPFSTRRHHITIKRLHIVTCIPGRETRMTERRRRTES